MRWWQGNVYISDRPEAVSIVQVKDLVDSLWLDRETRRKTRVCYLLNDFIDLNLNIYIY